MVFDLDYIPPSGRFYAYAVSGRADEIFVTLDRKSDAPIHSWAPPGQSEGHYVFRLDLTAGSLRFIRWNDFKNAEPAGERVLPELLESYPEVRPSGKTDPFAVAYPFRSGLRQDSDDRLH